MKKLLLLLFFVSLGQINAQLCFNPPVIYSGCSAAASISLVSKDFNLDGKIDLAVAGCDSVYILIGDGTGSFGIAKGFLVGFNPYSVCSGDFNQDGKLDLATANYNPSGVGVIIGDGMGNFSAPSTFSVITNNPNPMSICSSDFNGDSFLDLAIANGNSSHISILFGNGLGAFSGSNNFSTISNPFSIISADFNKDGKADLAAASGGDSATILIGNGAGNFTSLNFSAGPSDHFYITCADFDGDTILDLATVNYTSSTISFLKGVGNGSFAIPIFSPVGTNPTSILSSDINGDGFIDLATTNSTGTISILLGNGMGGFSPHADYFMGGAQPNSITSADYNGDGKLDIVTANYSSNYISVLLSCSPAANNHAVQSNIKTPFIYPNPASDQFNIETNTTEKLYVDLYDVNGRHVFSTSVMDKSNINVATFDNGIYTLTIKTADRITNKKIVILH